MLSPPDEGKAYLTIMQASERIYLAAPLGFGAYAPDLFQKHLRFGGLEIKRRILGMNANAKITLRVLRLPSESYVYLRKAMST